MGLINYKWSELLNFSIGNYFEKYWSSWTQTEKLSFFLSFIVGFLSHSFIYLNRLYGNHDVGMISRNYAVVQSGRWFNNFINFLNQGYILPVSIGIFNHLFLAFATVYVLKIFNVQKKGTGFLIASLMTTYPSVAVTNLFLYDAANYNFAILLAVLSVYYTIKYKMGYLFGAISLMLTLAIYQSKLGVAIALIIFFLMLELLSKEFEKHIYLKRMSKFIYLLALSAIFYLISLGISFVFYDTTFSGQRGFSPEEVASRFSNGVDALIAILQAYYFYLDSFFGILFRITNLLRILYAILFIHAFGMITSMIFKRKIYKDFFRVSSITILIILTPLGSNISGLFATNVYTVMIYPFVLTIVFIAVMIEKFDIVPIARSLVIALGFIIVFEFITLNNAYYLQSLNNNVRLTSISTRIAGRIDLLWNETLGDDVVGVVIYDIPNTYVDRADAHQLTRFRSIERYSYPINNQSFIHVSPWSPNRIRRNQLLENITGLHGVVIHLASREAETAIRQEILETEMPVWPSEGSVAVINNVIVINFGTADLVFDEIAQSFTVRHTRANEAVQYEYHWAIYQSEFRVYSLITQKNQVYLEDLTVTGNFVIFVSIENLTTNTTYPLLEFSQDLN